MPADSPPTSTARRLAAQLKSRLDGHAISGDAFVASVYGEWGVGKTRCLRDVEKLFGNELEAAIERLPTATSLQLVLPVFFDPWQYEHEEHLVVPLLKTIELALVTAAERVKVAKHAQGRSETQSALTTLGKAAGVFGDVAVALLSGFKFKFAPLKEIVGIEVELAPKEAFTANREALDRRKEAAGDEVSARTPSARFAERLEKRESLYFDMRRALADLTRDEGQALSLRFVVLIDDLDRCLPEKAVQMLESVKLFLNVPGFCFVLAVDDEVVERGIAHRYQAYAGLSGQHMPISGAEYLEKVVHLPVHLQRWTKDEAKSFLLAHYPLLFAPPSVEEKDKAPLGRPAVSASEADELMKLVLDAMPLVPRKLIRLAEALEFQHRHFSELGALRLWQALHAARLIALQQLYPGLYRHLRLRANRYWRLFSLKRDGFDEPMLTDGTSLSQLQTQFDDRKKAGAKPPTQPDADSLRENLTLLQLVHEAGQQRGSPNPLALFPADTPNQGRQPDGIRAGFELDGFANLYLHGLGPAPELLRVHQLEPEVGRVSQIANAGELMERLLGADALNRREYLQAQKLDGRLPDDFFGRLLEQIKAQPERLIDIEWLRDIAALSSPEQLLMLYQQHDVIGKMLNASSGALTDGH